MERHERVQERSKKRALSESALALKELQGSRLFRPITKVVQNDSVERFKNILGTPRNILCDIFSLDFQQLSH